jgi:hypothetical protein
MLDSASTTASASLGSKSPRSSCMRCWLSFHSMPIRVTHSMRLGVGWLSVGGDLFAWVLLRLGELREGFVTGDGGMF